MSPQSYCLNLHERYSPDWGAWECARELFANAKDAAPEGMSVESPNANTLKIFTPTVPGIAELFIIGCGSKAPGDESIGQFGEGLKLAALAATRKPGGSLTIRLPEQTITFAIREHFGQQVLFADIADSDVFDGCLCTLVMEGAGFALNGKIIEGEQSHAISKDPKASVQVFCKGVWICAVDEADALFSYNLNDITLNRDRSHADPWSIRYSAGSLLLDQMTDVLADKLIAAPHSWESAKCLEAAAWGCSDEVKQALADAIFRRHGKNAVIETDARHSRALRDAGYQLIRLGAGLHKVVSGLVPIDVVVASERVAFTSMAVKPEWKEMLTELYRLASILDLDEINIEVFPDTSGDTIGKADGITVWLNERLFHSANRFERVRTFVHEAAHIQSGNADATTGFENGLDLIAGKLALQVLTQRVAMEAKA